MDGWRRSGKAQGIPPRQASGPSSIPLRVGVPPVAVRLTAPTDHIPSRDTKAIHPPGVNARDAFSRWIGQDLLVAVGDVFDTDRNVAQTNGCVQDPARNP